MDFKSLYCFAELIRLQSFSATASALNLTQPTVSKIIQALEEELGVPLLVQRKRTQKAAGAADRNRRRSLSPRVKPSTRTRFAAGPH